MLRKCIVVLALGLTGSVAGLFIGQSKAFACGNGVCGYFKNGNDSAWCNVLPDPSIKFSYGSGNCWLNSGGGNGHSLLFGDNSTAAFLGDMNTYLNGPGGNGGYNNNSTAGAAFIIDDMLGIDFHNGSTGNGINDARAQFGYWSSIINSLGANQCSNGGSLTCPGKSFGINWAYTPPYFCSSPVTTSGYDPFGAWDTPFYNTAPATCDHDWRASVPEIVFYWNNGANSFHVGSQCGNVQSRADKLPAPNQLPSGGISVTCNPATGQQTATVTLSDPDGATTGYITTGVWTSGTVNSPGPVAIAIPLPPTTDPYVAQGVSLHVRDVGALGSGNYNVVANDNTQVPCASFGCGSLVVNPARLDPYMRFSLGVSVTNNIGQAPPGATISLTVTPPAGGTYSYVGSQAAGGGGGVSTATFNNLGPTTKTGLYTAQWTLTGSGVSQNCSNTFPVVYLPYLNVYGGDVMTGASPSYNAGSSTCLVDGNGGIFSWNNTGASYAGAGTQYAVEALGAIQNFATALDSTNTPPLGLSFANSYTPADPAKANAGQGLFGGYFTEPTSDCDFTSDITTAPAAIDTTIGATTVATSTRVIRYVSGADVYISGNIVYASTGGWANISQIPYFKLVVVGGDIYINRTVTQLDGIYVAESDSAGNKGRIYTCATGLRAAINPTSANYYSNCNSKLTINGAFVARQVQFLRTSGSLGQANSTDTLSTNSSAEVFNYTPELWLPRGASLPDSGYTAITGLPPIL